MGKKKNNTEAQKAVSMSPSLQLKKAHQQPTAQQESQENKHFKK